jgi:hypothetical protein
MADADGGVDERVVDASRVKSWSHWLTNRRTVTWRVCARSCLGRTGGGPPPCER